MSETSSEPIFKGKGPKMSEPTILRIRAHRDGWKCFESEGVAPYYTGPSAKEFAIAYAKGLAANRRGEIRIFNAAGQLEKTIPFDKRANK